MAKKNPTDRKRTPSADEILENLPLTIEKLEERVKRLDALVSISSLISSTLDLDSVLRTIMDTAESVMNAEASSLLLADATTKSLYCQLASGIAGPEIMRSDIPIPFGQGIAGLVAETGKEILIADAYADERFNPSFDKLTGFKTRSILCVPIFAKNQLIAVAQVLNRRDRRPFDEEDLNLFKHFCVIAASALYNARLHRQLLEKERVEKDLQTARIIQQSFLPQSIPSVEGFKIETLYHPAMQVGGDFFDVFTLKNGSIALLIGDVSGKGMSAALHMARLISDFRFQAEKFDSLAQLFAEMNRLMYLRSSMGMFVTTTFMLINPATMEGRFVNAGHPFPIISQQNGQIRELETARGIPLGILQDAVYSETVIKLAPGDAFLFYTDGAREALDKHTDIFGTERLLHCISKYRDDHLTRHLLDEIEKFRGPAPQHDDITLMVLKVEK